MIGVSLAIGSFLGGSMEWFRHLVETATGWGGLVIVAVYSFLIAFVLPLPSEVVLAAPLEIGIPRWLELAIIISVSSAAKAAGSIFAFHIGHEAKEAGPVLRAFERLGIDVREWSKRQTIRLAKRHGYAGLATALSVPFFPDTFSIYAFSILGEDYLKFAAATFAGSVGRLLVTLFVFRGTLAIW